MTALVVFASPSGGVGRTTLVAHVAAQLTAAGKRCLAVDLDPQNALAMQLSGNASQWIIGHSRGRAFGAGAMSTGLVDPMLSVAGLTEYLRMQRAQVAHVPFGVHDVSARKRAEQDLLSDPRALRRRLLELSPPRCEIVLLDTPAGRNVWSEAALALADMVIVPVLAQPAALAALPAYKSYLAECAPAAVDRVHYVVNQWNPTRQLACDVFDVLMASMPARVLPHAIHDDEQLREQLAFGAPLALDAGSQAHVDIAALADVIAKSASSATHELLIEAQAS